MQPHGTYTITPSLFPIRYLRKYSWNHTVHKPQPSPRFSQGARAISNTYALGPQASNVNKPHAKYMSVFFHTHDVEVCAYAARPVSDSIRLSRIPFGIRFCKLLEKSRNVLAQQPLASYKRQKPCLFEFFTGLQAPCNPLVFPLTRSTKQCHIASLRINPFSQRT